MNTHEFLARAAPRVAGAPGMAPPPGGEGGQQPGAMQFLPLMIMLFAIFYFLVFRPQQKKQKEQKQMLSAIRKGDQIVTAGGIHGVVAAVKENTVLVKVADNVKLEFSKTAIAAVTKREGEGDESRQP